MDLNITDDEYHPSQEEFLKYLLHQQEGPYFVQLLCRQSANADLEHIRLTFFKEMSKEDFWLTYHHRHELFNYYRFVDRHPFPSDRCYQCEGVCNCRAPSREFYVSVRFSPCPNMLKCKRCLSENARVSNILHHNCFDYFSCKKCDEDFQSAMRNSPEYASFWKSLM